MQLKRQGVELRLIVSDHNHSAATVDLSLLKAVARAHRWFDEIDIGKLSEIAAREGLAVRHIGRLIRLVFLSASGLPIRYAKTPQLRRIAGVLTATRSRRAAQKTNPRTN
jgi:hypothetical protein